MDSRHHPENSKTQNDDAQGTQSLRLVGLFLAPPLTQEQQAKAEAMFRRAFSADGIAIQHLPVFKPPALPVFEDESGSRFVFMPDANGTTMPVRFDGEATDMDAAASRGGFVLVDTEHGGPAETPDLEAMHFAAVQLLGMHGALAEVVLGAQNTEGPRRNGGVGGLESLGQGLSYAPAALNMLTGPMAGMDSILTGIGQFGLGHLMSMGTQQLLGKLFAIDDGSSLGSQLGAIAGQRLADELQSMAQGWIMDQVGLGNGQGGASGSVDGYKNKLELIFNGVDAGVSNASVPVGRVGDGNTANGSVAAGAGTVLVNDTPAARLSDLATMTNPDGDSGPIQTGNPSVLVEGQPLSGDDHIAVGTGRGIIGVLQGCSPDVFMGPLGIPVPVDGHIDVDADDAEAADDPESQVDPDPDDEDPSQEGGEVPPSGMTPEMDQQIQELVDQLANGNISPDEFDKAIGRLLSTVSHLGDGADAYLGAIIKRLEAIDAAKLLPGERHIVRAQLERLKFIKSFLGPAGRVVDAVELFLTPSGQRLHKLGEIAAVSLGAAGGAKLGAAAGIVCGPAVAVCSVAGAAIGAVGGGVGAALGYNWFTASTSSQETRLPPATSPRPTPSSPHSCFVAGTLVHGPGGAMRIEAIRAGDRVYAWHADGAGAFVVRNIFSGPAHECIKLNLGGKGVIVTTPKHRFYVEGCDWVRAEDLTVGMRFRSLGGNVIRLDGIGRCQSRERVYNIEVATAHNYFVGEDRILVHNMSLGMHGRRTK